MKKNQEVKELSVNDLRERIAAEKAALAKVKMGHATSPVENPQTIRAARRGIARMLTELNAKQATAK